MTISRGIYHLNETAARGGLSYIAGFFHLNMDSNGLIFLSHPAHFVLFMGAVMLIVVVVSAVQLQ